MGKIALGVFLLVLACFIGGSALRYADPWGAGVAFLFCLGFAIPGTILLIKGGKSL
jgi:hypothetical protein